MDDKIPYIVYEASEARADRRNKRLVLALILSIILIFISNALWLWAWSSYDYSSEETVTTVEQDAKDGGNANYIGKNGDINNGLSKSNSNKESTPKN